MGRGMEIILIIGSFIGIFFENITYYNKNDIKIENVNIGFNPLCYRMYESKLIPNLIYIRRKVNLYFHSLGTTKFIFSSTLKAW